MQGQCAFDLSIQPTFVLVLVACFSRWLFDPCLPCHKLMKMVKRERSRMGDDHLEEVVILSNDFSEDQSQTSQLKYENNINELLEEKEKLAYDVRKTIHSIRAAADEIDRIHRNGNITRVTATGSGVIAGAFTVGAGIATLMTAGAAAPLFFTGCAFGGVSAITGLTGSFHEAYKKSKKIRKAESDFNGVVDSLRKFIKKIEDMQNEERGPLKQFFEFFDANSLLKSLFAPGCYPSGRALEAIKKSIKAAALETTKDSLDDVAKPFIKISVEAFGKLMIGFGAMFMILDATQMIISFRDVIERKKSEAAENLRQCADGLERSLKFLED